MHVIGTAGHVDHGKSTLVRALTGIDPDRFEEEKRRGLTIDLGFAWCTLPSGREIGIVDVPGHERFIRNMLAGVGSIDAALFVVAADEGWMPQSAEHLQILDFLEITGGVVALTKADTVSPDDLELVHEDVRARLEGTILQSAVVVPVSAVVGAGLDELRAALDELLDRVPQAADGGRPRMFVDRSFTIAGAGTVVTGTLAGGALRVGDEVEIVPRGVRARIRSLQTHRRSVDDARPGSRVAANLVGLERSAVTRGDAIVHPGQWRIARTFVARVAAAAGVRHPLTARGAYELYLGTTDFRCRLKLLEEDTDAIVAVNTPSGLAPGVRPGASALVQVFYGRGLPLDVGDRFVIRDVGRRETVAGGVVLDQDPGVVRRGNEAALARLRAREGLTGIELAARIVAERGAVRSEQVATLAGLTALALEQMDGVERLAGTAPYLIDPLHANQLATSAVEHVRVFHESHPLAQGISVSELRRSLGVEAELFGALLDQWTRTSLLVRLGAVITLPERSSRLPQDQRTIADTAIERLRAARASPPSPREAGIGPDLASALERAGELVLLTADIAYPADVWRDIERRIIELIAAKGPASVAQVRETLGTSRKYAVPLLERLDALGVTRRTGNVRELGPRGRELAGIGG